MKRILSSSLIAIATLASLSAHGQTATVQDAWVRATVPQQKATGAFMKITAARPMKLVGVKSPAAPVAEIHEMRLQDNVMKMRPVDKLDLPAGQAVELKPGGYHVMLMDLAKPVKAGDTVPPAARAGRPGRPAPDGGRAGSRARPGHDREQCPGAGRPRPCGPWRAPALTPGRRRPAPEPAAAPR